uniref:Uncharacterized protein n=1 Tax=Picea sitchensis TaxID=3332 RepID=A9NMD3_PICSI|nr:unknown [Picea sitchensis]
MRFQALKERGRSPKLDNPRLYGTDGSAASYWSTG